MAGNAVVHQLTQLGQQGRVISTLVGTLGQRVKFSKLSADKSYQIGGGMIAPAQTVVILSNREEYDSVAVSDQITDVFLE